MYLLAKYSHYLTALELPLRPTKMPHEREAFSLVRVRGVEPLSQPWEGHIIAVIRHPHLLLAGYVALTARHISPCSPRSKLLRAAVAI